MSEHVTDEHLALGEALVAEAQRHDGLAPVDLDRFWADQEKALQDPWGRTDCPQAPLGIHMSAECLFAELGIEEDWYRLKHDPAYRIELSRRYNDLAEPIVGRRLLSEEIPDPALEWPEIKGLHDIFEARNEWRDESYWLMQSAATPDELSALLDRVDARLENLREFMLPPNWDEEKARITAAGGQAPLYRSQRGPITFAMSIYGLENVIFLIYDKPDLAERFRDTIRRAILERARVLDEEAGFTPETAPRGWSWADDNSAMLTADLYEFFGFPIVKGIFDRYSPDAEDRRYQHSDSAMGHLLPVLAKVDLTGTNFGPTVMVEDIREHLPHAVIHGQLAPFVFSRNEEVNIVAELVRDYEMAREKKGWVFTTAGSINNGSRLTGMRLIMAAIQRYGRY